MGHEGMAGWHWRRGFRWSAMEFVMSNRLQKPSLPPGTFFPDLPVVDPVACDATPCRFTRFSVTCEGEAEYPEDDPIYGTYWVESVVNLGPFDSLDQAIVDIEDRTDRDDIGSAADEDALSYSPRLFKISDNEGRLVLAGDVRGAKVRWCVPVVSDEEALQVTSKMEALYSCASLESGWDNHSTASRLRFEANILGGRLVDPLWRTVTSAALATTSRR